MSVLTVQGQRRARRLLRSLRLVAGSLLAKLACNSATLPAGVSALTGAVGLQDWNQICGDGATFSVSQGGVTLWTSDSLGTGDPAQDMGEIAVSPGTLTLTASPNSEYTCDTASWLDVAVR